ncbi:SDR family oxidoreductase [Bacteriovoracales bacterium]|nr:SDR family oxidoreductase [Bacteriovoracales bacterium]
MRSIKELSDLTGRVALITGGAGHIGRTIAEGLAELGASIAIVDINADAMREVTSVISEKYGTKCEGLKVDLENEAEIKEIPRRIEERFGSLNIVINNAAFVGENKLEGWVTSFSEQSIETWRRAVEVNLTAAFALTQACTDLLKKSKRGSVINIGSTYGLVGPDMSIYKGTEMGNPAAYAASKGGLIQLTRWLSTVLAPEVRVNSLSPGGVERGQPKTFQSEYVKRTPLKRMASEEDYKGAALYLASDLSSYVTGHNLVVDGGWTAW